MVFNQAEGMGEGQGFQAMLAVFLGWFCLGFFLFISFCRPLCPQRDVLAGGPVLVGKELCWDSTRCGHYGF